MPHPFYNNTPDPRTSFTRVKLSTYEGRLHLAYLTLTGKNWRNGGGPSNTTLEGYNPDNVVRLDEDLPKDMMFVVRSYKTLIAYRDVNIYKSNLKIKDPRKHEFEWIYKYPSLLNPVQLHHLEMFASLIVPEADYWDKHPPYVNAEGLPPTYMQSRIESRYDSGDDEMGPEYYGAV